MIGKRFSNVFLIVGSSIPFGMARNILLARELSEYEMGVMSLLITLLGFIYPITLLGQHNALIRFLSKGGTQTYNWKKYIKRILSLSTGLGIIGALISGIIYGLSGLSVVFVILAVFSSVVGDLYKEIPRSEGNYEFSLLMQRGIRYIFPIILAVLIWMGHTELNTIIIVFCVVYAGYSFFVFFMVHRMYENGHQNIPRRVNHEGMYFFGMDVSLLILVSIDRLVVAKFVSVEKLAVYFAIFTVMRLYDISYQATEYILLPHSNKAKMINIRNIFYKLVFLGIVITGFYVIFGNRVIHLVYGGRYDHGTLYIPLFCAIGLMRLFYSLPASIIGGRLSKKALKQLCYMNTYIILLNLAVVGVFTWYWSVIGALYGTLIVWIIRNVIAYLILIKNQFDNIELRPEFG